MMYLLKYQIIVDGNWVAHYHSCKHLVSQEIEQLKLDFLSLHKVGDLKAKNIKIERVYE